MQGGHPVHGVASDNGEIGHADHLVITLLDEGERADFLNVSGPHFLHLEQEALVGLEDDLQMARKHLAKESDAPLFERLR